MISLTETLSKLCDSMENFFRARCTETWERCESPIEQRMCCGLVAILGCIPLSGEYYPDRRSEMARLINRPAAFVFAQHPLGPYRVDFLVVCIDPTLRQSHSFVVECDGAAYHDAERDRERDACLILEYGAQSVQRFSGKQIESDFENTMRRIGDILRSTGVDQFPGEDLLPFPKNPVEDRRQRHETRMAMLKDEAEQTRVECYRRSLETGIWQDDPLLPTAYPE